MRIERTGQIPRVTPRVVSFLTEALGAVDLDEMQSAEERRADFLCLRGLLAIEMKTLEEDGSERLDNLTEELRERDDWPIFLGSAPIQAFIQNTNDPEGLNRRVLDRMGRGIINHLKKANRQLEAHAKSFGRQNIARALVLINEDHDVHDPHTVGYVLWHAVRRTEGDKPLYGNVDFIVYMTERHGQMVDGVVIMPTLIIEGPGAERASWKGELATFFVNRWIDWNGARRETRPIDLQDFQAFEHIPEIAPRSDRWRTEYQRNPYMRSYSEAQVRDYFDEVTLMSTIDGLKNPPIPRSQERFTDSIRRFGDLMEEMAHRAIPITHFAYEPERAVAAARRLGLPPSVEEFIWGHERDLAERGSDQTS